MDEDVLSGLPDLPDFLQLDFEGDVDGMSDDEASLQGEIEAFFLALLKTIRASQLYVQGNPLLHQFFDDLQRRMRQLWERTASLSFAIYETEIRYNDQPVYKERLGAPENIAFQFYKDGIRRIEFFPGVEEEEIRQFIEILRLARTLREDEDDLLTLLWSTNFSFLRYEYVDVLGDEPPLPKIDFSEQAGTELPMLPDLELSPEHQAPALAEDFEPSLYFLDEADVAHLQQELQREWSRPIKQDVMLALLDQFEIGDKDRRYEVMAILRQMLPRILAEGDFVLASMVVAELGKVADKIPDPEVGDQVDQIIGELSEPIVLEQLVRILEDGLIEPGSEELATLLNALKPGAILVLMESIPLLVRPGAKQTLAETLDRLARLNPAMMQDMVRSDDPRVAAEAAKICGRLKMSEAADSIALLLDRPEHEVRISAVAALVDLRTSRAGKPLLKAIRDTEREVRLAAARGLTDLRFNPGAAELELLVRDKKVWKRDLTEQRAIFEAYAAAAGSDSIKLLSRMLNGRRFLWFRYPSESRACAARGIGIVGTDEALNELAAGKRDRDPLVRSAVHAAQRGPTEDKNER